MANVQQQQQQQSRMPNRPAIRTVNLGQLSKFDSQDSNSTPRSPGGTRLNNFFSGMRMERQNSAERSSHNPRMASRGTSRLAGSPVIMQHPRVQSTPVHEIPDDDNSNHGSPLRAAAQVKVLSDPGMMTVSTSKGSIGVTTERPDETESNGSTSPVSPAASRGGGEKQQQQEQLLSHHAKNSNNQPMARKTWHPDNVRLDHVLSHSSATSSSDFKAESMDQTTPGSQKGLLVDYSSSKSPARSEFNSGPFDIAPRASSFVEAKAAVHYSSAFPLHEDEVCAEKFIKIRQLGRGAIGKVYLVKIKDDPREQLYAMKVITKEEMISKNKVRRVMTEREVLASTSHPYVVGMYASFQTTNKLYYCMEYMAGGELYKFLQKQPNKRVPEHVARFFVGEILLALEYLHHQGFIYRDLKPENILMHADGHLALADFDLSKQATRVRPKITIKKLSLTNRLKGSLALKKTNSKLEMLNLVSSEPVLAAEARSFVGTEEYLAPEVVVGEAQTPVVDWWTLGILLHEMIYGVTPFVGAEQEDTFQNILNKELKFPSDVEVSRDCKDLLKRLLTRQVTKRIGFEYGADEIKTHKWFEGVNFALLRNEDPPVNIIVPELKDLTQYTTSLADMEESDMSPSVDVARSSGTIVPPDAFAGFDMFKSARPVLLNST